MVIIRLFILDTAGCLVILLKLQKNQKQFSKSELKIADVILQDPEAVVLMSTAELARRARVSDPMVLHFCRRLECKGFPEFKVMLAQSLAQNTSQLTQTVANSDTPADIVSKLISANQSALEYLRNALDQQSVAAAIELLDAAARIEIFGMGGSASIAQDAQHRLFRLGTPVIAYEDTIKQFMAAASLGPEALVLAISFTGRTAALVDAVATAKNQGARILGITTPDSPLGELCDVVLTSCSELEDTTLYVPMTVRILILTIIDILATGLALKRSPRIDQHLHNIKESLDSTKIALKP